MDPAWHHQLYQLLGSVKNSAEMAELFDALFTPSEKAELAKRWQVIAGILNGQSQRMVRAKLGVGIGTVERGAREIKYGSGIFQKLFKRLQRKIAA